jgi:glycine hydroxymethyltransferase
VKKLLFVCTGNICRSPMAEGLWRHMTKNSAQFQALSAGVSAVQGQRASPHAVDVLRDVGVDISRHRSQPVSAEIVRAADLILAMTSGHAEALAYLYPEAAKKTFLIREFDPAAREDDLDVMDPIGMGRGTYANCRDTLCAALPALAAFLQGRSPAPDTGKSFRSYLHAMTDSYPTSPTLAEVDPEIARAIDAAAKTSMSSSSSRSIGPSKFLAVTTSTSSRTAARRRTWRCTFPCCSPAIGS